jgi:hypothetical protein
MAADPEPGNPTLIVDAQGAVQPNAGGPEFTNMLQMDGGMARIVFHQFEASTRELLHFDR